MPLPEELMEKLRNIKGCGHPKFYEILVEMAVLHDKKNTDYASPEAPLQNFTRVAHYGKQYKLLTSGFESVKTCVMYMLKQIDASFKLLGSNQSGEVEGFKPRMMDVAVYAVLSMILYDDCVKESETNQ